MIKSKYKPLYCINKTIDFYFGNQKLGITPSGHGLRVYGVGLKTGYSLIKVDEEEIENFVSKLDVSLIEAYGLYYQDYLLKKHKKT